MTTALSAAELLAAIELEAGILRGPLSYSRQSSATRRAGLATGAPTVAARLKRLAQAYVRGGDTPKARSSYEDFFALWEDADTDIPLLQQAKAEYAKLHSSASESGIHSYSYRSIS
jgi:hypothetical protein